MRGSAARRRGFHARGRRRARPIYGSERQVSPGAVELLETRLSGYKNLNIARRRAVFLAAQLLSHFDQRNGARLPQGAFSSDNAGRWIQEGLCESGAADCIDWHSWKPTHRDFNNAKARAFIPSVDFLWADTGPQVVSNFADYISGRFGLRAPLHSSEHHVFLCAESRVEIPANVLAGLQRGSGLRCDFEALRALTTALAHKTRARKLCAAFSSVGRVESEELQPLWSQRDWGRLYASKPALVNMPTVLLSALRSVKGDPLWQVDFSSFELRITGLLTQQTLPGGDVYGEIAEGTGITRDRVKSVINPLLHGQRQEQIWYAKEPNATLQKDRPLVEREMKRVFPHLMAGLDYLRRDGSLLQREGARIFFSCMGTAMEKCGISAGYLPKHDGWVFGATQEQAFKVRQAFQDQAECMTGQLFPVTLESVV